MQLPARVIEAINSRGQLYEVGGAVRDRIRYGMDPQTGRLDPGRFWSYSPEETDYLATGLPMEGLVNLLSGFGRTELVGKSFGVVKFRVEVPEGKASRHDDSAVALGDKADSGTGQAKLVDLALPRRERSTGAGHRDFEIDYDPELPIEQDLGRRDFTINAMARPLYAHEKLFDVIDPHGGMADIRARLVRMVSSRAFEEDPLRMLRACQFAARFEYALEEETFRSIKKHSGLIAAVSQERVQLELNKMLTKAEQPSVGLWLMQRTGLLKFLLPELEKGVDCTQPGGFHRYSVFEHSIRTVDHIPRGHPECLALRLAALLHDVSKPQCREVVSGAASFYGHERQGETAAREVLERLKYSREIADKVCLLVRRHMFAIPETPRGLRRLISKVGLARIYDLIELRRADIRAQGREEGMSDPALEQLKVAVTEEIHRRPPFALGDLKIDGRDIMAEFNLPPGPEIGRLLEHLLEYVLDDPARNQREVLLDEAARTLSRTLP
jgi:poly(A) polymerase/tRNA nucleotidyltransferase (CCA-adding enzyme)